MGTPEDEEVLVPEGRCACHVEGVYEATWPRDRVPHTEGRPGIKHAHFAIGAGRHNGVGSGTDAAHGT